MELELRLEEQPFYGVLVGRIDTHRESPIKGQPIFHTTLAQICVFPQNAANGSKRGFDVMQS